MNIKIIDWIKSAKAIAEAALPKSGGVMTGPLNFKDGSKVITYVDGDSVGNKYLLFDNGGIGTGAYIALHSSDSNTLPNSIGMSAGDTNFSINVDGSINTNAKVQLWNNGAVGQLYVSDNNDRSYRYIGIYAIGDRPGGFEAFKQDSPLNPSGFNCRARGTNGEYYDLAGRQDGSLRWRGADVLTNNSKLGSPVYIGSFGVGSTYTAPSFGMFTGRFGAGSGQYGSLSVDGQYLIEMTNPDSGYGTSRMPVSVIVGAGANITLLYYGTIFDARFIPFTGQ